MTAAIPIYQGQDFYIPQFEVRLRKRPLAQQIVRDIVQASYRDSLEDVDSFELTVNNWDAETRGFKYSGSDAFLPGDEVELWMGYYGQDHTRLMIQGEITALRPSFPASGQPTLAVSGLNTLHKLRRRQESHVYEGRTDSQVAQEIAGRLGIEVRIDDDAAAQETRHPYLIQNNQYDVVFLMERARRIGYDLFVVNEAQGQFMYFRPSVNVRTANYQLTYGRSLIEFQPNLDTSNQVARVTVRSSDATRGGGIKATVDRNQIVNRGVSSAPLRQALERSFADREEVISNRLVNSREEAQTLARERLEMNAKQLLTASGSTVGLPDLRAGTVLMIDGLDGCFDGRYFVTATTHAIGDGGYTTQFDCRREEV
jgi:uncharacterized protein